MLDVAELREEIWNNLTEVSIARCWTKSDILPKTVSGDLVKNVGNYQLKKSTGWKQKLARW